MNNREVLIVIGGWLTALLFAGNASAEQANSRFSATVNGSLGWQDNIGLASAKQDKFDVTTTQIDLDLGYKLVQQQGLEIEASVRPFYAYVGDLTDLSNYGAEFGIGLLGEFGPNFTDPWYSLSLDYTAIGFKDSDPRDGSWLEFEAALGKRFSPAFGLSGGYRYFQRWQKDNDPFCQERPNSNPETDGCSIWITGEVFDHKRNGGFAHADLFFGDRTNLFVEYTFWKGDVSSTGRSGRRGAVVTSDQAFGTFTTAGGGESYYLVWRSDADQHVAEVAINRQLGERWNAELSLVYLWTTRVDSQSGTATAPIDDDDYENFLVNLSIAFRL